MYSYDRSKTAAASREGIQKAVRAAEAARKPLSDLVEAVHDMYGHTFPSGSTEGVIVSHASTAFAVTKDLLHLLAEEERNLKSTHTASIRDEDIAGAVQDELEKAIEYAKTFIRDAEHAVQNLRHVVLRGAPWAIAKSLDELEEAVNKIYDRIAYAKRSEKAKIHTAFMSDGGPVGQVLYKRWNELHDLEHDLQYTMRDYDDAAHFMGGPAEHDAKDMIKRIQTCVKEIEHVTMHTFTEVVEAERKFVAKYGSPSDYADEMRAKTFPR
jgi:hypothetical protein